MGATIDSLMEAMKVSGQAGLAESKGIEAVTRWVAAEALTDTLYDTEQDKIAGAHTIEGVAKLATEVGRSATDQARLARTTFVIGRLLESLDENLIVVRVEK